MALNFVTEHIKLVEVRGYANTYLNKIKISYRRMNKSGISNSLVSFDV